MYIASTLYLFHRSVICLRLNLRLNKLANSISFC